MMTFKEYLLAEGKFPGSPQRGSELRAAHGDEGEPRAKRNKKNLPDERNQAMGRRSTPKRSWKSRRKTQYK